MPLSCVEQQIGQLFIAKSVVYPPAIQYVSNQHLLSPNSHRPYRYNFKIRYLPRSIYLSYSCSKCTPTLLREITGPRTNLRVHSQSYLSSEPNRYRIRSTSKTRRLSIIPPPARHRDRGYLHKKRKSGVQNDQRTWRIFLFVARYYTACSSESSNLIEQSIIRRWQVRKPEHSDSWECELFWSDLGLFVSHIGSLKHGVKNFRCLVNSLCDSSQIQVLDNAEPEMIQCPDPGNMCIVYKFVSVHWPPLSLREISQLFIVLTTNAQLGEITSASRVTMLFHCSVRFKWVFKLYFYGWVNCGMCREPGRIWVHACSRSFKGIVWPNRSWNVKCRMSRPLTTSKHI